MSKQITPAELSLIVSGLLIDPEGVGELDSPDSFHAFFEEVTEAVASACGGEIVMIDEPMADRSEEGYDPFEYEWTAAIAPNDSLPCLLQNVWSPFDTSGWEQEELAAIRQDKTRDEYSLLTERRKQLETYKAAAAQAIGEAFVIVEQYDGKVGTHVAFSETQATETIASIINEHIKTGEQEETLRYASVDLSALLNQLETGAFDSVLGGAEISCHRHDLGRSPATPV